MIIRNGFVSNSSSSSFIIQNNSKTELQFKQVIEHIGIKNLEDFWAEYLSTVYVMGEFDPNEFSFKHIAETIDKIDMDSIKPGKNTISFETYNDGILRYLSVFLQVKKLSQLTIEI